MLAPVGRDACQRVGRPERLQHEDIAAFEIALQQINEKFGIKPKAVIEAVEPSPESPQTWTYWQYPPCHIWAVTPDGLRQPPTWVTAQEQ